MHIIKNKITLKAYNYRYIQQFTHMQNMNRNNLDHVFNALPCFLNININTFHGNIESLLYISLIWKK